MGLDAKSGLQTIASADVTSIGLSISGVNRTGASHRESPSTELAPRAEVPSLRWRLIALTLAVHLDAFRIAPLSYLQGIGWRARGLRIRSRHRIAALAGRSPRAYALWIERHGGKYAKAIDSLPAALGAIYPVIDCRQGTDGLEATLASLSEAGLPCHPILIGDGMRQGYSLANRPRDLEEIISPTGAWVLPMFPGDRLAPGSLVAYARAASERGNSLLIYADDDLIGMDGRRTAPHFKPDWNPELFEHHDFLTASSMIRVDRGSLAKLPDEGWAEALARSAIERDHSPAHVKQVLHHRRSRPQPIVPPKPDQSGPHPAPSVSIIIPTRNRHELLRTCLEGLKKTTYPSTETIIVDNDSDEPETLRYLDGLRQDGVTVLRVAGPFNYSALNNAAVEHAAGELLCFLNNDVELTDEDWLALLVRHAVKPDIGAVGARLLYPDGTIQHAGVFTGLGGGAGHAHRFQAADDPGYFERARLPQRVSAVTGACMLVARQKFLAVGGFDEERFPVAFNDVDLCLKLNLRGWQSFYEPRSTLIHHESKSRGSDRSKENRTRFAGELAALKRVWKTDQFRDPYHHPCLSPFCEQFLVSV